MKPIRDIDRAIEALFYIPPDLPSDDWHEVVRAAIAAEVPVPAIIKWCSTDNAYPGEKEVLTRLRGITPDGGTGAATLFYWAKKYGYRHRSEKPSKYAKRSAESDGPAPVQIVQDVAARLAELVASCEPATETQPYIKRKLGLPDGTLVYRGSKKVDGRNYDGALVIPMNNLDGQLVDLQFIPVTGKIKYFLWGIKPSQEACFIVGGELAQAYLVEGIGHAWSAHQATRAPAIGCFGKGRMAGVAKAVRARYPDLVLVIVPDEGGGQKAAEIARAVGGLYFDPPSDWPSKSDINDMHVRSRNLRDVECLLESAKAPSLGEMTGEDQFQGSTLNDVGNAHRLVAHCGQDIRWLTETKKWMIWNGQSWEMDEVDVTMRLAKETVRLIYNEARVQKDADKARQISRWANSSSFSPRLTAMRDLAKSEPGITMSISGLDNSSMLLGTPLGVIDLNTGLPTPACREYFITKKIGTEDRSDAKCPLWEQFLRKCFNGNDEVIRYFQRAVGYTLTGSVREHKLFFLYGSGANGKSVCLETLRHVLGDYAMHAPADMFMQSKMERASNGIARLKGARMVTAIEVEDGQRFAESLVKQLTGGDRITARFLYGEYFEIIPTAKFWFAANHKPIIRGEDNAIWRRFDLIPFSVTIPENERDKELSSKLKAEAAGILRWGLQGAIEWNRIGLCSPNEITIATALYKEEMDIIAMWLKDCCEIAANKSASRKILYSSYVKWSQGNGIPVMRSSDFSTKLEQRRFVYKRCGPGMKFFGLQLI